MAPRSDHRAWARAHMVGVENTTMPSFTADMSQLDEDGIRLDVRQAKAHGFFSTLVATETGLSFEEAKRFVEIVCDEAGDDLQVSTPLLFDSFEQSEAMLRHAESVGVSHVLLGYPTTWRPQTIEEVEEVSRAIIDSTDLGVVLYPSPHYGLNKFSPAWFPIDVLQRLVDDCPNVVGMKVGELGLFADCHHRFGDQILLNSPVERDLPTLATAFGVQWMGAGCYEVLQSTEHTYVVDYFALLREGRVDEAMQIYWRLVPARTIFDLQHFQTVFLGTHHWTQQKFYQWCTGGNGGITREPSLKLGARDMMATKMGFMSIGVRAPENDDEFYIGRAAAARGEKANPPALSGAVAGQ